MNRISAVSASVFMLCATGICYADSLVITYRSGKTQTVVLDEPSQAINSWQFESGTTPQTQSEKSPPVKPDADTKQKDKPTEKKSDVRFKWNAKPIPD